ncbi:Insulin-like growth factor-binding protein complex acid labile subunit [Tribolium castaneum]|uniref:Insulin-like growth factor-binding protein complex acid labile subunit n=1 Tax=Tribolium castaneum TaxID=7070 RepID=D2A4Z4_TRICA|nr:Insulin-like growth factor-binding protein complex acid labile subunit [Tribolium castaneum]
MSKFFSVFLVCVKITAALTPTCERQLITYETVNITPQKLMDFVVKSAPNDKVIVIVDQIIPILCQSLFKIGAKIDLIEILANNIEKIEPNTFFNQNITQHITITGNRIPVIERHTFANLEIMSFNLNSNEIQVIEVEAFANLPKLDTIYLNQNKLQCFNPHSYYQVPELKFLEVTENKIKKLERKSLSFVEQDDFYIFLQNNQIGELDHDSFADFKRNALHLVLNCNFLESLPDGIFNGHTFEQIDLAHNPLKKISGSICDETCSIKFFYLSNDSFKICDRQFLQWAESRNISLALPTFSAGNKIMFGVALTMTLLCIIYFAHF